MNRTIEFKSSFDRLYRKLHAREQEEVDKAIDDLLSALEAGEVPHGLGLKRLQDDQWEIRVDIRLRIGFRMQKNTIEFATVGSHDVIKNFLKNFRA